MVFTMICMEYKITSVTGKERDDLEIKDYVALPKPQEQDDRLPPPRTLIMDFTLTHTRFGHSSVHPIHYRQLYLNRPDPIAFIPVVVDTSGRIYDDFSRLLFLHTHREASTLPNELLEESDQFRFLHAGSLVWV